VNGRAWTKRETAVIRRDYPHKATKLIAAVLKRPLSGIYKAAESLGVKKSAAFAKERDYFVKLEKRLADGLKLFEDFYWPPPEDAPEEAQRIRDIIAALKGTQS
jgi:hypothetical protein